MACHSVLVAIITVYLSTIAYGTSINISETKSSLLTAQDDESTTQNELFIPEISDHPTTLLLEVSTKQVPKSTISEEDKVTTEDEDSENTIASQKSSEAEECKTVCSAITTPSSTSIVTPSPINTTISVDRSTLPAEIPNLNFTAIWQIDEDEMDYIMVVWSEESHEAQQLGWKLLVSRESDEQSQNIYSSCSWHENSTHQVKLEQLLPMKYLISCNANIQREDFEFIIKPCLSYDLLLIPLYGEDHSIRKTKLKPIIKRTAKIESFYNANDNKLVIRWEPAHKNMDCGLKYRYDLNVERVGNISETIDESSIEYTVKYCTNYSISVWSIIIDNNGSEIKSDQPARHAGRTENQGINMRDVKINARPINETCIIVNWSINNNFRLIVGCGLSIGILLYPPSERGQHLWMLTYDKQAQEEMLCHLRPGTEYKVSVEVLDHQGQTPKYTPTASVSTPSSAYDTVTVALVVVSSLLILILLGVCLYCTQPWFSRSKGEAQSVRWKSSFFGNMGRRRSHPIKLRNLNAVTQRLCSSAGHLLEMEFEDLVIIADARRPKDSPIALLPENAIKNRYVNILPYEHNRVPLSLLPDCPDSNYINASYIMGFNDPKEYIATQGPKICTIEDFWRMAWEQNVYIIIMVTSLEERGKPKCDQYWPENAENPLTFNSLSISHLNETDFESYTLRSFQVERNGKSRTVKQSCLKGWPDFGVPDNPEILIRFIEVVRILAKESSPSQTSSSYQPIVVHCSAGVGRTGTFIAVDWLMQEARVQKEIDIFSTILRMRECRLNMVQSEEQYEYIYRCMSHFVNTRLFATVEQSHDAATLLTNGNNPLLNELG